MNTALLVVLLMTQFSSPTFEKIFGKEKVDNLVSRVARRVVKERGQTYRVLASSLESDEFKGLSEAGREGLVSLAGTEVSGEATFIHAVEEKIGQSETDRFRKSMLSFFRLDVRFEKEFYPKVRDIILLTTAPADEKKVEEWLERGFERFVLGYISFLKKPDDNSIVVGIERLDSFLNTQRARCGERPCSIPPCCGNCHPCPEATRRSQ